MEDQKGKEERLEIEAHMIHLKAEEEREKRDPNEAVRLHDEAIEKYERAGNYSKQAEALAGKVIDYRHLARRSRDGSFLVLAEKTAEEAVEVSKKVATSKPEASTLPIFNLATVQEELGRYDEAVQNYRKAIGQILPIEHNTPAFRAYMQLHLYPCEYKAGDKEALPRAEKALVDLEKAEHNNEYEYGVWLSGGHMRIADAVKTDDPGLARDHMSKAKTIIDKDPKKFHLRQEQWAELSAKIA